MDSFYREKKVKAPRKEYRCAWCTEVIKGEHLYITGKTPRSDFMSLRVHEHCHDLMQHNYCVGCRDSDPCLDPEECYRKAKENE